MTRWTTRPDPTTSPTNIPIIRVLPGKPLAAIITAADTVGAYTHYWRGRTTICTHPTCEPCDAHRMPRWYGYLAVVTSALGSPSLFEITPSCLDPIDHWLHEYGTLRGALIKLQRANKKPNSRLTCSLSASQYAPDKIPAAPNVQAHLERIWEIDTLATAAARKITDLPGQRTIRLPHDLAGVNGRPF